MAQEERLLQEAIDRPRCEVSPDAFIRLIQMVPLPQCPFALELPMDE